MIDPDLGSGTEDFRSVNKEEDPRSQIPDPVEMIWDLLGSDPRSVWNDGMNKIKVPYGHSAQYHLNGY